MDGLSDIAVLERCRGDTPSRRPWNVDVVGVSGPDTACKRDIYGVSDSCSEIRVNDFYALKAHHCAMDLDSVLMSVNATTLNAEVTEVRPLRKPSPEIAVQGIDIQQRAADSIDWPQNSSGASAKSNIG